MSRKMIEYALVVLVAIIVSLVLIYVFFPWGVVNVCAGCVRTSLPLQREECEKQFNGVAGSPRVLQPGTDDEYLIGFYDPALNAGAGYSSGGTGSGGYSGGSSGSTLTPSQAPIAGYVMVRARPQISYDSSSGSYSSGTYNPGSIPAGQAWDKLHVAVVSYVSPLRNESTCSERAVTFFGDKFEAFCDLPTRFLPGDPPKQSYRVFVLNNSDTPVEYCIVSNCDQSHGKVCQFELANGQ